MHLDFLADARIYVFFHIENLHTGGINNLIQSGMFLFIFIFLNFKFFVLF